MKKANDDLKKQGYIIEIFDAYRPQSAVDHFKRWAKDLSAKEMKPYYYPTVEKSELFKLGYIAEKSAHSRGAAVDLTIVDMMSGQELDMGSAFDFFGDVSHSLHTDGLTETQINNRMILRRAMMANGFKPMAEEWWHFSLENEPYPDTYFDFPIAMPNRDI